MCSRLDKTTTFDKYILIGIKDRAELTFLKPLWAYAVSYRHTAASFPE